MRLSELHYRWEWRLKASPQELWPLVSDTNRFNHDTRVPAVQPVLADSGSLPNARRRLRFSVFGLPVEWEEEPFEWVRPYRFGVIRRYLKGPVAKMRVLANLAAMPNGGTQLVYQVWARPRSLLGLIAIPAQIGWLSARRFSAAFLRYDALAAGGHTMLDAPGRVALVPGARARLAKLEQDLLARGGQPDLVDRLVDLVGHGDELTLTRLRPYVLADCWNADRIKVLELCLLATRAGLLDLQWNLLCPLCRGAKQSHSSLGDIQPQVHCDTCKIDFTVNFDRLVELTFRPNAAVRRVQAREFCIAGPQVTPHVVAQKLVQRGEQTVLVLTLEPGRYRLRTLALPSGQLLHVVAGGMAEATLRASGGGWPHEELSLAPMTALRLENATEDEQLFILERLAWTDQAATAAEVTALQVFRDLFSKEALRPGDQISVGSLTILFTDICGSTRLYQEIGDPPAFGLVMDHFKVLREAIVLEGGSMVKTVGDAVMAVFPRPVAALRAVLGAQRRLASPPSPGRPLLLRAGVHQGHCIAVTLNERLDYFGATVNIAARLEGLSAGGDVIISAAIRTDPEVEELVATGDVGIVAEPFEAALKGFEEERFQLWRVAPIAQGSGPSELKVQQSGKETPQ
jgi:class 3 adenylate cyclase